MALVGARAVGCACAQIICLHYLMRKACIEAGTSGTCPGAVVAPNEPLESVVTYRLLLQGLWGCAPALFFVLLPSPRLATMEAKYRIKLAVGKLRLVLGPLLHGACHSLSALDRVRIDIYCTEIESNIQLAERALADAYFEPWPVQPQTRAPLCGSVLS